MIGVSAVRGYYCEIIIIVVFLFCTDHRCEEREGRVRVGMCCSALYRSEIYLHHAHLKSLPCLLLAAFGFCVGSQLVLTLRTGSGGGAAV